MPLPRPSFLLASLPLALACANLSGLSPASDGGSDAKAPPADAAHEAQPPGTDGHAAPPDASPEDAPATVPCNLASCSGYCVDSRCVIPVVGTGVDGAPSGIATDKTRVYWSATRGGVGRVLSMPLGGGMPTTLVSSLIAPQEVVLDDTFVYWLDAASDQNDGVVGKVPKTGGAVTTLASSQPVPAGLAVTSTDLYVCNQGYSNDTEAGVVPGLVIRLPLAGGTTTTIAADVSCVAIATDTSSLYWSDFNGDTISKRSLAGGPITTVVSGVTATALLRVGDWLYWGDDSGAMNRFSLTNEVNQPVTPEVATAPTVWVLAADSTGVYWSVGGPEVSSVGTVMFLAPDAGAAVKLTSGPGIGYALALGPPRVFFGDLGDDYMATLTEP